MQYEQVLEELFSLRARQHMRPDLSPMVAAVKVLGNPHEGLEFVHITGTNGKGSTAAFLTSVFRAAGLRVGTYTSPFLVDFRERIMLDGRLIPKDEVVRLYERIMREAPGLSFFEVSTLMALLYFAQERPDIVVWEVGLGGSFDATRVVDASTAVITNVSLDHTNVLGAEKELIARDKCGIINRGARVFSAEDDPLIRAVILESSQRMAASVRFTSAWKGSIGLAGEHQRKNAGLAAAIAEEFCIRGDAIRRGIREASWPGRLQFIGPNVLVDCAHNPAGMVALSSFLRTRSYERLFVVMGVSAEKDVSQMIAALPPYEELVFTRSDNPRALAPSAVRVPCTRIDDPLEALAYAKGRASPGDLVLVAGSIFLVGEVLRAYRSRPYA